MRRRHRPWTVRAGDAESLVAEARKALFVMVGFLVILWIIQLFNAADRYQLTINFGIRPHDVRSLPDVVIAPFLHVSWTHIESNSGPLFIFGFLAAFRGVVHRHSAHDRRWRQWSGLRLPGLHPGARVLRSPRYRHPAWPRHGAVLCLPVHGAPPAQRH